jgi:DNA gyrase subunit A
LANEDDRVVGIICLDEPECNVMVVSENGYGKRSVVDDYRITNRGGKGVKTINITEKTGGLIAIKKVTDDDDLMIINKSGIAIRLHVDTIRVLGRATQGVRLINLGAKDAIAAVSRVPRADDEEEELEGTPEEGTPVERAEGEVKPESGEDVQNEGSAETNEETETENE